MQCICTGGTVVEQCRINCRGAIAEEPEALPGGGVDRAKLNTVPSTVKPSCGLYCSTCCPRDFDASGIMVSYTVMPKTTDPCAVGITHRN